MFFRVGLIGCGIISEAHVKAYKAHSDRAQITVCCDVDRAKAEERAASVPKARVVTDWRKVVADPDVEAVEVCTPHHLHTEIVVAAAKAGKHILCQKPLARTLDDCRAMTKAANENNVVLFYGEMNRTSTSAREAKRVLDAGRIGQVVGVQATYAHHQGGRYLETAWRYNPDIAGGGALLDGGIHLIDLMLHLGGAAQAVQAFTTRFRPELGGEDTSVVNIRYENGALGSLFSSHAAGMWYQGPSCVVVGTHGVLVLGGPTGALTLRRPDLPDGVEVLLQKNDDAFQTMIGCYLDTVLSGAPNPSPGAVGMDDLAVVLAAYQSAETGREIALNNLP